MNTRHGLVFAFAFIGLFLLGACTNKKTLTIKKAQSNSSVLNVSDFGAKGDGVQDDSKAIQSAIQHIKSKGGGVLMFGRSKKYIITKTIVINGSHITLDLNQSIIDARGIKPSNGAETSTAITINGKVSASKKINQNNIANIAQKSLRGSVTMKEDFVRISNKELLQNARSYYYKSEFIQIGNSSYKTVTAKEPILSYESEVLMEEIEFVKEVKVLNGYIDCVKLGRTAGITFTFSKDCLVKNVEIRNSSVSGICFNTSLFGLVESCKVISRESDIIGFDYGILFTESQYCTAKNNYLNTSKTGIDSALSHYIVIENNETRNCGISPHAGTNITVQNNTLNNGSMYFRSYKSKILNNKITITGSGLGAIVLAELNGKGDIEISGNVIRLEGLINYKGEKGESFNTGIYSGEVSLHHVTISNNSIIGAGKGIYVFRADNNSGNNHLKIINNTISDCEDFGINASRYSHLTISGNTISGLKHKTIGITLWESGGFFNDVEVKNNTIKSVNIGLRMTKGYDSSQVKGNIISEIEGVKLIVEHE